VKGAVSVAAPIAKVKESIKTWPGRSPRPGRPRIWLVGAAGLVVVVAVVAIVAFGGSSGTEDEADDGATALARVEQGRLASRVSNTGTLGYAAQPDGTPYSVVNQASGVYTQLPSAGDEIGCGDSLYRVDDDPVPLLCGGTPLYRPIDEGVSGPDVRELNRNLVHLGYAKRSDLEGDQSEFGSTTADALAELQDDLGLAESGSLALGDAVFLPGPLRITRVSATLATMAQPGSPVAQATSTRRRVEVALDPSEAGMVAVGDRARVMLPDNSTTAGKVTRIGTVAGGGSGSASGEESESTSSTIPVYVKLERDNDAGTVDEAPVQVEITTDRVNDALSVPVTALLARAAGGYAVETVGDDGQRELVSVELGAFDHANGLVQVTGSGLAAGDQVVVPAT
jgi:Putative peptidoglycan binding domain